MEPTPANQLSTAQKTPPRKPDPANYGWSDGKIRNDYLVELYLDVSNNEAGETAMPEWLSLKQDYEIVIHAFNFVEANELADQAPARLLRGLGIPVVKEERGAADGATVECFFNGPVTLKTARVLTREDVLEFFGDVPLFFQSHYKQEWCYEGRKDHYVITWAEIDTDHRYSVDVKQPVTLNDRDIGGSCLIVDERSNLIVFQKEEAFG